MLSIIHCGNSQKARVICQALCAATVCQFTNSLPACCICTSTESMTYLPCLVDLPACVLQWYDRLLFLSVLHMVIALLAKAQVLVLLKSVTAVDLMRYFALVGLCWYCQQLGWTLGPVQVVVFAPCLPSPSTLCWRCWELGCINVFGLMYWLKVWSKLWAQTTYP